MVSHTFPIIGEWSLTLLLVKNGQSHFSYYCGMVAHTTISDEWSVTSFLLVRNGQSHFPFCDERSVTLFFVMNGQSHFPFCDEWSVTVFFL